MLLGKISPIISWFKKGTIFVMPIQHWSVSYAQISITGWDKTGIHSKLRPFLHWKLPLQHFVDELMDLRNFKNFVAHGQEGQKETEETTRSEMFNFGQQQQQDNKSVQAMAVASENPSSPASSQMSQRSDFDRNSGNKYDIIDDFGSSRTPRLRLRPRILRQRTNDEDFDEIEQVKLKKYKS